MQYTAYNIDNNIIETSNFNEIIFIKLHRNDGPAFIEKFNNGTIKKLEWFQYGKCHRKDKPAVIHYFENGNVQKECWYINGKQHREGGPAVIIYNKKNIITKKFFLNGQEYKFNNYKKLMLKRKIALF